jgi:predicted HTH domain antitoxin
MPETARQVNSNKNSAKNIPLELIIDYVSEKHLSVTDTAKLLDCNKSNISQRLKRAGISVTHLDKYAKFKADVFETISYEIAKSVNHGDLQKAGLSQKITTMAILEDKIRVLRGQATDIIGTVDMVKAQELVQARMKTFEDKYGLTDVSSSNEGDK